MKIIPITAPTSQLLAGAIATELFGLISFSAYTSFTLLLYRNFLEPPVRSVWEGRTDMGEVALYHPQSSSATNYTSVTSLEAMFTDLLHDDTSNQSEAVLII